MGYLQDFRPDRWLAPALRRYLVPRLVISDAVLAGLYSFAAFGSLQLFATLNASVSPVWPPTGLAIGALLLFGPEIWPGVFVGAFAANYLTTTNLPVDAAIAVGNTLEAVAGYYIVVRYASGVRALDHARSLGVFLLAIALVAPLVSATVGASALALAGLASWSGYLSIWLTWWLGDASGALIVTPLLISLLRPSTRSTPGGRREFILLTLTAFGLLAVVFASTIDSSIPAVPLGFTTVPLVVWGGLRFGPRGASASTGLLSVVATGRTLANSGPFLSGNPNTALLSLQFSLMILAMTGLALGAVVGERIDAVEEARKAREAERRFQTIVDSAPDGIIITDDTGKIVQVNFEAAAMFGYTKDELPLVTTDSLFEGEHDFHLSQAGKETSLARPMGTMEWQAIRKNGSGFPVDVRLGTLRMDGKTLIVTRISDISDRRRVQEEREQLGRLSAVGEATSMIGHDLRNPLQTVAGAVFLLLEEMENGSTEKDDAWIRNYLLKIQDQTVYMNKIVKDLQDYTRPLKPSFAPVDLSRIVKQAVSTLPPREGLDLRVKMCDDPLPVPTDSVMFERILSNILTNALDAMPKGGELSVEASRDGEHVTIRVADTGTGMSPETLEKIYNPFFTTKPKGQGLGLSVTKRLVEALNGKITVQSQEGKGTTFTITLPTSQNGAGSQ